MPRPQRALLLATLALAPVLSLGACRSAGGRVPAEEPVEGPASEAGNPRFDIYRSVRLHADLSHLSARQREMVGVLIDAAGIMDELFWRQAYGDREALLAGIDDSATRRFAEINYGPWDRLAEDASFVPGVGPKPPGANLYPRDATGEELEAAGFPGADGLYTIVRRSPTGELENVPYSKAFRGELKRAADLLLEAADLSEDEGFGSYLRLRAEALLTDEYRASDMAWMDNKSNLVELVYGPIETYEDKLFGAKAAFEAYVLIKDVEWSKRLERFAAFLPGLQEGLPVDAAYKAEVPGGGADLNAYDVVYFAGDCNAGAKTIAINLPNDERVQLEKGTRRLQLKNAMRAKFDEILLPIAGLLIDPEQRGHVTFDAFFGNTMFHEVAHGLGIKNTLDGQGTVRSALAEHASALEEGKADILGLYMITALTERGELPAEALMDNYVTFLAGIFRSVRFGASSAHGRANMVRFNFFEERGAFTRDARTGTYRVDSEAMQAAMTELSRVLLTLQGDGDREGAGRLLRERGVIGATLQADLDRLGSAGIPVDVVFEQGREVLGL